VGAQEVEDKAGRREGVVLAMAAFRDTEIEFFPILGNVHGWSDDPPLV
jgi:hypothetical protein